MKNTSTSAKSVQPKIELLPPSITMRVGRRRLTLSWRPRKQLPSLLSSLLHRSWRRVLAPVLKVSVAAAAVCGAWQTQALAAAPAPGTLPAGWNVVNGNVTFTQNGNTLNINQLSPKAIAEFASFSIGSGAVVDISQPSSAAAFLAKVTGGDISQIYGKLTAPGTVVLFNPNGVMVGAGGVVDVGRFVASTLNISNDDFLAGRLTFAKDRATVGSVENYGNITSATGGSVYLIGSSVTNGGIIKSPQGEVILAAGQSVTLADTATPGVTVNVTGSTGDVTNLGTITAEAGRIGIAAGLITNSGNISASSVVREGGRIFLRASNNLTTTANSSITADGTAGGNITLFANNKAFIDGDVSATGAPGHGGFVETSGLGSLDVVKVPTVGSGGTWYIDPYDLEVVAGNGVISADAVDALSDTPYAVTSTGNSAKIGATLISNQLNLGVNVNLATTGDAGGQGGNITVSSAIAKTSGLDATLTLNADNNISINADITSTSGALSLNLNTGYRDFEGSGAVRLSSVNSGAKVILNGGSLRVSDGGEGYANGALLIANGSVSLDHGSLGAGAVTLNSAGKLNFGENSQVDINSLDNAGVVNVTGYTNLSVSGDANNTGTFNINAHAMLSTGDGFNNAVGGRVQFTGTDILVNTSGNGQWINNGTINMTSAGQTLSLGNKGGLINNGVLNVTGASVVIPGGFGGLTNNGTVNLNNGIISLYSIVNQASGVISGNGTVNGQSFVRNEGVLAPGGDGATGTMTINGNFSQTATGTMKIDLAGPGDSDQIYFGSNTVVANLDGTLQTTILGNYEPTGDSFIPFSFAQGTGALGGSYFRNVTGTVLTINGAKQMMKATYGEAGVRLALMGATTFYATGTDNGWGAKEAWKDSSGNTVSTYLPTQIDNVVIDNVTAVHDSGADTVNSLTVKGSTGRLNMSGGDLTVVANSSISDSAQMTLNSGNISFGNTSIDSTSRLFVNGGNMTMNNAAIDGEISVYTGNLILGGLTTGSGYLSMFSGSGGEGEGFNGFSVVTPPTDTPSKSITMANAKSDLSVQVSDGDFTYTGAVRLSSLRVYGGTVTGTTGSQLNVADTFVQQGGALNVDTAALSSGYESMSVGNITANNLVLESRNGSLSQNSDTFLHVKKQLIASAVTGIDLGNPGFEYTDYPAPNNQIAAFAASNSGVGDITLINHLNTDDASVVTFNGIKTANGNVRIENYGGMRTAALGSNADFLGGLPTSLTGEASSTASKLVILGINSAGNGKVETPNGTVSMVTHSPLTIGIGGITASGGITLTAGSSSGSNDNLVINGIIQSLGGNINLTAGDGMTINANISTSPPGFAIVSVLSGQVVAYAQGVTITDANGVVTPVPLAPTTGSTATSVASADTTNKVQAPTTQAINSVVQVATKLLTNQTNTGGTPPVSTTTTSSSSQTVGGTAGSFGDESGQGTQGGKKALPMCT